MSWCHVWWTFLRPSLTLFALGRSASPLTALSLHHGGPILVLAGRNTYVFCFHLLVNYTHLESKVWVSPLLQGEDENQKCVCPPGPELGSPALHWQAWSYGCVLTELWAQREGYQGHPSCGPAEHVCYIHRYSSPVKGGHVAGVEGVRNLHEGINGLCLHGGLPI